MQRRIGAEANRRKIKSIFFFAALRLFAFALIISFFGQATIQGQVPKEARLGAESSMAIYKNTPNGKILEALFSGKNGTPVNEREISVDQFEMKAFRDGQSTNVQLIAQAPKCLLDVNAKVASNPGPLQIFTPTTNFFIQGNGFFCTESNHLLIISNQVETHVKKTLLKSPMLSKTNEPVNPEQMVKIFADRCQYDFGSNTMDYIGHIHVIDAGIDMTSKLLSIQLSTNGAVETILAQQDVVITTTNKGQGTGETAFYFLANSNETMELTGNAVWRNGAQEAKAQQFTYDSTRHILTGADHVQVHWPNNPVSPAPGGSNSFRELFTDFAVLQFPPDNGPVESMIANAMSSSSIRLIAAARWLGKRFI
jgi:lipopolysaccharide export system protein LptA